MGLLLCINGLPGTGKTTISKALIEKYGGTFFELDKEKHKIAEELLSEEEMDNIRDNHLPYSDLIRKKILQIYLDRNIEDFLGRDFNILEVCLPANEHKAFITDYFSDKKLNFLLVEATSSIQVIEERLKKRLGFEGGLASLQTYYKLEEKWENRESEIHIENNGELGKTLNAIELYIKRLNQKSL